jgi:hypothetical protein
VALSKFATGERRGTSGVPPELGRYLAWAAARSLPMRALYQSWLDALPPTGEVRFAEPPPPGFGEWINTGCTHRMEHPALGVREDVPCEETELLRGQGWHLSLANDDFLALVHLQAWYFQVRFFPRLKWLRLRVPEDRYFVIGDRPVVWGFADSTDAAPYALRNPLVQLVAPLSSTLALFAHNPASGHPEVIMPGDINRILASAAHEWIAGPTEKIVRDALSGRAYH